MIVLRVIASDDLRDIRAVQLGHTWAVAMRPDLRFDVYESFITHYTLHDYLARAPEPLTLAEMLQVRGGPSAEGTRRHGALPRRPLS